jgi:hypothetical protein
LFKTTAVGLLWFSDYAWSPYSIFEAIIIRRAYIAAKKFFGKFGTPYAYLFNLTADLTQSLRIDL